MYTPVGNYMLSVRKDFDQLFNYLKTRYNVDFTLKYVIQLKIIHKFLWITVLWRRYLIRSAFYDDIVLNIISLIHNSVNKDINVMNFLLRKSIEDFIRFMAIYIEDIKAFEKVDECFDTAFKYSKSDGFLHKNWEILKSIYSECCQTVHSNLNIESQPPCICLKEYDNQYDEEQFKRSVNEWTKSIKCFCNIMIIYNTTVFKEMAINDQSIIRDFMSRDDLDEIFKRLSIVSSF